MKFNIGDEVTVKNRSDLKNKTLVIMKRYPSKKMCEVAIKGSPELYTIMIDEDFLDYTGKSKLKEFFDV